MAGEIMKSKGMLFSKTNDNYLNVDLINNDEKMNIVDEIILG